MNMSKASSHIAFTLTDLAFRTIDIPALPVVIGRKDADIVVEHPSVSGPHARLELVDGSLRVQDLASRNGTRVNGQAVLHPTSLRHKDMLQLGSVVYQVGLVIRPRPSLPAEAEYNNATLPLNSKVAEPTAEADAQARPMLLVVKTAGRQRQFLLQKRVHVIGRQEGDIRIADPALSRRHCQIEIFAGHVWLKDLASVNGTFVNNERISFLRVTKGLIFTAGGSTFQLVAGPART